MNWDRTIVSAMYPFRYSDDCAVFLLAWFEEIEGPVPFVADPMDCERHGKEIWIRAMAGEYGTVTIIERNKTITPPLLVVLEAAYGDRT